MELRSASVTSIQKHTATASLSQWPARLGPYCEMLRSIVPKETTAAGMNNLSVGCSIDALKVSG